DSGGHQPPDTDFVGVKSSQCLVRDGRCAGRLESGREVQGKRRETVLLDAAGAGHVLVPGPRITARTHGCQRAVRVALVRCARRAPVHRHSWLQMMRTTSAEPMVTVSFAMRTARVCGRLR